VYIFVHFVLLVSALMEFLDVKSLPEPILHGRFL